MSNQSGPCPPNQGICSAPSFNNPEWAAFSREPSIKVEEKGKKYIALNPEGECVAKVRVDSGLINDSKVKKADYIVLRCDRNMAYIVELKGSHVAKACEQILSTVELLPCLRKFTINARIICSRTSVPDLRSSHRSALDDLCRSNSGNLKIKGNQMEESFRS